LLIEIHFLQVMVEEPSNEGVGSFSDGDDNDDEILPDISPHHEIGGSHEPTRTGDDDSNSGQGDSEDEDNSQPDSNADEIPMPMDDIPLDEGDILLDVDDMEIFLDEYAEDEVDEELSDKEPDVVGDESLPIAEEHRWLPSNLNTGCVWDADDYSCAFDAVFMTFYSIYGRSDQIWRNIWKGESPEWNGPLGNLFDLLLSVTTTSDPRDYSSWFSRCRDIFRDQVTESNPLLFPRGHHFAPVGDILQRILGGTNAEPLACQNLACVGCGAEKPNARLSLSYLCYSFNLDPLRYSQDPDILPLQLVLARYVEKYSVEPGLPYRQCRVCQAAQQVISLRLLDTPWTWFELEPGRRTILPSLEIEYPQQRKFTLQAVIYLGSGHFTARMRKGPSTWWNYDGMRRFGKPLLEVVTTEDNLLVCDDRDAVFLIYHQGSVND
jgi:hypothetical protein